MGTALSEPSAIQQILFVSFNSPMSNWKDNFAGFDIFTREMPLRSLDSLAFFKSRLDKFTKEFCVSNEKTIKSLSILDLVEGNDLRFHWSLKEKLKPNLSAIIAFAVNSERTSSQMFPLNQLQITRNYSSSLYIVKLSRAIVSLVSAAAADFICMCIP